MSVMMVMMVMPTKSAVVSATEAASTEATASATKASTAKDDGPSATSSVVATNILCLVAPHDVATEGTLVGYLVDALAWGAFDLLALVGEVERTGLATLRTTSVEPDERGNKHNKNYNREAKQTQADDVTTAVARLGIDHLRDLLSGEHGGHRPAGGGKQREQYG